MTDGSTTRRPRASKASGGALRASMVAPLPVAVPAEPATAPEAVLRPEKARTTKYTANLDDVTALAFDELALVARRKLGRTVDKSELLKVLVLLAADDASLRDQVIGLLPERGRGRR